MIVLLTAVTPAAQTPQAVAEGWKGKKVVLLPDPDPRNERCQFAFDGGGKVPSASATLLGKTGVVTGFDPRYRRGSVVVSVDGFAKPIKITQVSSYWEYFAHYCLGVVDERDAASKLVGRSLWAPGYRVVRSFEPLAPGVRIVQNASRDVGFQAAAVVRVVAVEWEIGGGLVLVLEDLGGQRGALQMSTSQQVPRKEEDFLISLTKQTSIHNEFAAEDPQRLHSEWEPAVWEGIRTGRAAVGMTKAMVEMICGQPMYTEKVVLEATASGSATFELMKCAKSSRPLGVLMQSDVVVRLIP